MYITFLVGNGFDVSIGAKTSYTSFYEWYCKQPSRSSHIKKFKDTIKADIESGGENWSDFEIGLGKYTAEYTPDTVSHFFDCYEDAHDGIVHYLREEESRFDVDQMSLNGIASLKGGILNFYKELNPQEQAIFKKIIADDVGNNTVVDFISFNYTNLIDACIAKCTDAPLKRWTYAGKDHEFSVSKTVVHAHGTVGNFPILGVNDASQIANEKLLSTPQFSEVMIKPASVSAIGQLWHAEAENLISRSKIICVWGMSLGDSDAKWWTRITSWLKSDSSRHLIVFWHTKNPPDGVSVLKKLQLESSVKDRVLKFADFSGEVIDRVASQIHVVINSESVLNATVPLLE